MNTLREKTYCWLLLIVLLSMQGLNSVHIHEPQLVEVEEVNCDMCAHHVHHSGHFMGDQYHMHPCLSCQITSNQHFTIPTTQTLTPQRLDCHDVIVKTPSLPAVTLRQCQGRGPPCDYL